MIFEYRGIKHDQNEVALLSATKREVKGPTRLRSHYVIDWFIRGVKIAATQPELTTKLEALESQYGTNGGDAKLYLNDGVTETVHVLESSATINGVRVVNGVNYIAGWPDVWGVRTEYVYRRSYQIHLQAEVLDAEGTIFSFNQTVRQIGLGGADFEVLETLSGLPQSQITNLQTAFRAEQFGTAIGIETYPAFPIAMWPLFLKPKISTLDYVTPQLWGSNGNYLYPIVWRYKFLSPATPFNSVPSIPSFL